MQASSNHESSSEPRDNVVSMEFEDDDKMDNTAQMAEKDLRIRMLN